MYISGIKLGDIFKCKRNERTLTEEQTTKAIS
jgi:hypothetical protein